MDRWTLVVRAAALARLYYTEFGNPTGGWLHIVLDDDNVTDGHVTYCRDEALAHSDWVGYALACLLLELTEDERESVNGLTRTQ